MFVYRFNFFMTVFIILYFLLTFLVLVPVSTWTFPSSIREQISASVFASISACKNYYNSSLLVSTCKELEFLKSLEKDLVEQQDNIYNQIFMKEWDHETLQRYLLELSNEYSEGVFGSLLYGTIFAFMVLGLMGRFPWYFEVSTNATDRLLCVICAGIINPTKYRMELGQKILTLRYTLDLSSKDIDTLEAEYLTLNEKIMVLRMQIAELEASLLHEPILGLPQKILDIGLGGFDVLFK